MFQDVSPYFKWNLTDEQIGKKLLEYEGTPRAVTYFSEVCDKLTDYAYWFFLSTIWVSYSEQSDLQLWKTLFSCERPKRKKSIMKPSEVRAFETLPHEITAYRAHRVGETDWISYTLDWKIAIRFAFERGVDEIAKYRLRKKDVLALFMRRGEQELLMLHPDKATLVKNIQIVALNESIEHVNEGGTQNASRT